MKRILLIATLMALCIPMAAQEQPKKGGSKAGGEDVSSKLMDIEKKWAASAITADCNAVAPMLSEKWVSTDSEGKTHLKADMMQECKANKGKITSSEVSDMKVHMVNSNTAIVTGKWTGAGTGMDGKPIGAPERWTDTFVKEGGEWKAVASQSTKIAGEQPQAAQQ